MRGVVMIAVLLVVTSCGGAEREEKVARAPGLLWITRALAPEESAAFARVLGPRPFDFPADHGAHRDHQLEWWYWTGSLADETGRPFGFQFTVFRSALLARAPEAPSAWATGQSFMAHLALSDPERGLFVARERLAREALGLAGAEALPFRVWLEDWEATSLGGGPEHLRLRARDGDLALDLELRATKPLVLQGEAGFSPKGDEPGQASMYLSYTRLETKGRLEIGGRDFAVTGSSWMDHEWSTSVLGPGIAGWDWFSLQLDDGRELMLFELRAQESGRRERAEGTLVEVDGRSRRIAAEDFVIEVRERWQSPVTGASYPARWAVSLPAEGLELEVEPLMADQELRVSVAYWEGSVRCRGRSSAGPVAGRGFVELVGYSEAAGPAERSR